MKRPDFDTAVAYWQNLIRERGLSSNLKWAFRENLCLARHENTENFSLVFETQVHPVTLNDVCRVYNQVRLQKHPIVFGTLVHKPEFTLCTLLGDEYLADDDVYVEGWDLYFFAQEPYVYFEEVTLREQWMNRRMHEWKRLSGLDFVFCLDAFK